MMISLPELRDKTLETIGIISRVGLLLWRLMSRFVTLFSENQPIKIKVFFAKWPGEQVG